MDADEGALREAVESFGIALQAAGPDAIGFSTTLVMALNPRG